MTEQAKWDALLESEGLGIIDIEQDNTLNMRDMWAGKYQRLDARLNGVDNARIMPSGNMPTARGSESRHTFAEDVQRTYDGFDDDTSTKVTQGIEMGYNVMESLALSMTGTAKESEIAQRARSAIIGLDDNGRVRGLRVKRKPREPGKVWRKRMLEHIIGENPVDGPRFSHWTPPKPAYAHSDAGNGPLAIKDNPAPERAYSAPDHDDVRMSPVVDTLGYLPGRSPFQMSQFTSQNSDITG